MTMLNNICDFQAFRSRRSRACESIASCGRFAFAAAVLALFVALPVRAQVSVAPAALFVNEEDGFGAIYIANGSTAPQEVSVDFRFGYPAADSAGNVHMQYEDELLAEKYSIAPNIRAFPQRFFLPPGETQVVRLAVKLPQDAADGMYWTRVVTTSTPQLPFEDTTSTGVRARVQFRLQQITALFYEKGEPEVSVAVDALAADHDSTTVNLLADFEHEGSGPFFGTAHIRVLDNNGDRIHEEAQSFAVYVSEARRFAVSIPELSPGSYEVELTVNGDRADLPADQRMDVKPITGRTRLSVSAGG